MALALRTCAIGNGQNSLAVNPPLIVSKAGHTRQTRPRSSILAPTALPRARNESPKDAAVTRRPTSSSQKRNTKINSGTKSKRQLLSTPEATSAASAVPLPDEPLESASALVTSSADTTPPLKDGGTPAASHADESNQDKKLKKPRKSLGGSKKHSKNKNSKSDGAAGNLLL